MQNRPLKSVIATAISANDHIVYLLGSVNESTSHTAFSIQILIEYMRREHVMNKPSMKIYKSKWINSLCIDVYCL